MKEYKVISNVNLEELEGEVNNLLKNGWVLAGGISMAYKHEHSEHKHIPGHLVYAQAVEKK